MAPDLNSLPASRRASNSPLSARPRRTSFTTNSQLETSRPSPPSPSLSSLQAAATINANLHRTPLNTSSATATATAPHHPTFDRRRSSLLNNLSMNDPAVPAPGELQHSNNGSPRAGRRSFGAPLDIPSHGRQLSLGELHQELENEQEAKVNRLLHMIRLQQDQLAALSRSHSGGQEEQSSSANESAIVSTPPLNSNNNVTAVTTPNPTPESPRASHTGTGSRPTSYLQQQHSLTRHSSSRLSVHGTNSRGTSPALRPVSASLGAMTEDFLLGGTRDDCAFYQAETQMLTRENQMLKHRIRELERQMAEHGVAPSSQAASNSSPLAISPVQTTSEHDDGHTTRQQQ